MESTVLLLDARGFGYMRRRALKLRKTIAGNVRALRLEQGLTLEQLGKKCRLTIQYISRLEKSGEENVTVDNLEKLAKGLGVSVVELVDVTSVPTPPKEAMGQLEKAIHLLQSFQSQVSGK